MDHLIPSLMELLAPLVPAFRKEVFPVFRLMVGAWIVCLGRRTISRVWETTGWSRRKHHAAAFRLFAQAKWNWDEVMRLLDDPTLVQAELDRRLAAPVRTSMLSRGSRPSRPTCASFRAPALSQLCRCCQRSLPPRVPLCFATGGGRRPPGASGE